MIQEKKKREAFLEEGRNRIESIIKHSLCFCFSFGLRIGSVDGIEDFGLMK